MLLILFFNQSNYEFQRVIMKVVRQQIPPYHPVCSKWGSAFTKTSLRIPVQEEFITAYLHLKCLISACCSLANFLLSSDWLKLCCFRAEKAASFAWHFHPLKKHKSPTFDSMDYLSYLLPLLITHSPDALFDDCVIGYSIKYYMLLLSIISYLVNVYFLPAHWLQHKGIHVKGPSQWGCHRELPEQDTGLT